MHGYLVKIPSTSRLLYVKALKTLARLCGRLGWSEPPLLPYGINTKQFHEMAQIVLVNTVPSTICLSIRMVVIFKQEKITPEIFL